MKIVIVLTLAFFQMNAFAAQGNHKLDRKVLRACAQANNIALPSGSTTLDIADEGKIHACLKQYRISLHNCAESAGISLANHPQQLEASQIPAYRQCEKQSLLAVSGK